MKKFSRLLTSLLCLLLCFSSVFTFNACKPEIVDEGYQKNPNLDLTQEVKLVIASRSEIWTEMENVITQFEDIYPNCSVICEYIEDYSNNLAVRLATDEQKVDIFRTSNIQKTTDYKDYALNLISEEAKEYLDLSGANTGLVDNFKYMDAENTQYAIPYGGEMRGMYVNVTLLKKYNLEVPKNRAELMRCCEVLYENGYIPFQSPTGSFAQQLLYPYICNSIVNGGNYETQYASIEAIDDGVSEYFRDAYAFLYEIVSKGYYNNKRTEKELGYTFAGNDGKAKDFLNIVKISDDLYEKKDDEGKIAFLVDTQAFDETLSKTKSDYHSNIEYKFITSPVGEDGGVAYLSPSDAVAINNKSDNIPWALEFLNFFFTPEINTEFANESGKIPNTKTALLTYDIPANRTCDVGQMTFGYSFYRTVTKLMMEGYDDMIGISLMNYEGNMIRNDDGTFSLRYTLEDYMARLEKQFQAAKAERSATN